MYRLVYAGKRREVCPLKIEKYVRMFLRIQVDFLLEEYEPGIGWVVC